MKIIKKILGILKEILIVILCLIFLLIFYFFDYLFLPLCWLVACFITAYFLPNEFSTFQIKNIICVVVWMVNAVLAGKYTYYHYYKKYLRFITKEDEND